MNKRLLMHLRFLVLTLTIWVFTLSLPICKAQENIHLDAFTEEQLLIKGTYHRGILYPFHPFIQYHNQDFINGIDIRVGRDHPDFRPNKNSIVGLGIYRSNLANQSVFGNITGAFMFFEARRIKPKSFVSVGSSVASGIGYVDKPFNRGANLQNHAIGSYLNALIILSLDVHIHATSNLSFFVSPSLVHISNGRITVPNTGLNLFTFQFGVNNLIDTHKKKKIDAIKNEETNFLKNRVSLFYTGGVRQVNIQLPVYEYVSSTILDYSYALSQSSWVGIGADLFYNPSTKLKDFSTLEVEKYDPWSAGIHLSYMINWGRISFVMQPGIRLRDENPNVRNLFTRVGIRYRVVDRIIANCSLKSNLFVAEYIEWGIGYDLNF